jgi:8-oxo-dGTP pyrophosphatase MutT (NUDIX family)
MSIHTWKILSSKYLVKDEWLSLRADTCEIKDGKLISPFYIIECADWVNIVPVDHEGKILINRQYRHGSEKIGAEIPCGAVDADDPSPLAAASRELLEETGYRAERFEAIGTVYSNPGRNNNLVFNYIAYGIEKVAEPSFDEIEEIESELVTLTELMGLIDSGEFSHSIHLSTLLLALKKLDRITF